MANVLLRRWIVEAFHAVDPEGTLDTDEVRMLISRAHPAREPTMNQIAMVLSRHPDVERVGYVDDYVGVRRLRAATWRLRSEHRGTAEAGDDGGDDASGTLLEH